jgi:O-antigen ligase
MMTQRNAEAPTIRTDLLVLFGLLSISGFVTLSYPNLSWVMVVIPLMLIGIALTAHVFGQALLLVTTISMVSVVYNYPGLDPGEVVYYMLWAASTGLILLPLILTGAIRASTTLDQLYILFSFLLFLAIGFGVYFSGSISGPFQEALYFYSGTTFYFLYRHYLNGRPFQIGMTISFGILFLYVLLRTFISYRTALYNVVEEWELNFVRGAGNENVLLLGTIVSLAALLMSEKFINKVGFFLLFVVSIAAVILTMTRTLWVVTTLGMFFVFVFIEPHYKRRFIHYGSLILGVVAILSFVYWDFTLFIFELLLFRLESFGLGFQDLSLLERVYETERVLRKIMENPIMGWGFSTEYLRFDILKNRTYSFNSYIHNGYLAIWYKMGLFGLMAMLGFAVTLFVQTKKCLRTTTSPEMRIIATSILAYLPGAALMNITSPVFFSYEGTLLLFTMGAVVSWYQTVEMKTSSAT